MDATKAIINLNRAIGVQAGPVQLHIHNPQGDITITAATNDNVTVAASIEYDAAQWSESEVADMLTLRRVDNKVMLVMAWPDGVSDIRADLVVTAPSRAALAAQTGYGDIKASGFSSDIDIETGLGVALSVSPVTRRYSMSTVRWVTSA